MRVLDDPEDVTPGVFHRRHDNTAPDVVGLRVPSRAQPQGPLVRRGGVTHAPVRDDAFAPGHPGRIGVEPQLVAADVEADVERLVEVSPKPSIPEYGPYTLSPIRKIYVAYET